MNKNYKVFNCDELTGLKNINGNVKAVIGLSDISIKPVYEKKLYKVLNCRTLQPRIEFERYQLTATVDYITNIAEEIITRSNYSTFVFYISKDNITLNCFLDDLEKIEKGDTVVFNAEETKI